MTRDFFDNIRFKIETNLPRELVASAKFMFDTMMFQKELLKHLGYENIAPFHENGRWFFQKDGKFNVLDNFAQKSYISYSHLQGDILLCLDNDGYHYCEPSNKGEVKSYKPKDGKYFFLWGNDSDDQYTELKYLDFYDKEFREDVFDFVQEENYVAINYHKKKQYAKAHMSEVERWVEKPLMDTIISREKDICHIGVFTYYFGNKIVVYDGDELIVYDKDFNILYESYCDFEIWEVNSISYLLFPYDGLAYELSEGKEIEIPEGDECQWGFAKTYKDIVVLYEKNHFPIQDYYDDEDDWSFESQETPVRNTIGHVFDASFKLLRKFNVVGEISTIKEIGGTIVMKVNSSLIEDNDTDAYYNVKGTDITRHNDKTDEDFSIPDISFRHMLGYEDLFVVKTKVPSSDVIDFTKGTKEHYMIEKCGVYHMENWHEEKYKKIIDCKYDYIKSLPIEDDENVYYVGVIGKDEDNTCDLFINHKIKLQGIPFNKGYSIRVLENKKFIKFTNFAGNVGIIREGKFVLEPLYQDVKVYIERTLDYSQESKLKFLFVVSDGESYGICSPSGKLILPIEYSTIDMDDNLCIILDKYDEDNIEIGWYDEEHDSIVHETAEMEDGMVLLDDEGDYIWDGQFRYTKEDRGTGWENYSREDSIYDALGGEMDAIWNID